MIGTAFPGFEVVPSQLKAGLIIVHGIAEHADRYRHVAEALASQGIACFVYDQRGHGKFPGTRTHVANFAEFANDLELVGQTARKRFPSLPLFVWGHSMGSVVVTLAAIDGLSWARGVITSGCALDAMPKLEGAAGVALRIAAALAPRLRISLGIDATALTQVAEIQQEHMNDPLVPRTASLKLLYGFAMACRRCYADAPKITLPWLAVHGGADRICPVSGSQVLVGALGSRDKQLVTYPGLLHEVHNEDEVSRTALFELMTRWMLERYTVGPVINNIY
ncbi:MAG TPA: lysophospholipase [Steroidobacteraceae bacterium]|nr:lysophospholipase [Steroidobacteraceae bacterium]